MFLHGLDNARIERGDTIRNPKLVEDDRLMKFNVVVANPPFSLDKWGADTAEHDKYKRFWRGTPPKSRGDYAFITHMVETMNETDGRVGVVVPHGVLFRGGSEGLIRQRFIEENLLEGVIGLPANLFFGVGIPAALLFFRRDKTDKNVFFIDASREYAEGKNQNKLRDEDIEKIVATWRARTGRAQVRAPRHARGAQGERVQPQHSAVRRHVRGRSPHRPRRRQSRDRQNRGRTRHHPRKLAAALQELARDVMRDVVEAAKDCAADRQSGTAFPSAGRILRSAACPWSIRDDGRHRD